MGGSICGIYAIYSAINDTSYIGQASNIKERWKNHKSQLRGKTHKNQHLQRAWNLYGEEAFEFIVLEKCDVEVLTEREQFHMNLYQNKYNMCPAAQSCKGIKRSDETRARMSEAQKGRKPSPKTIEAARTSNTGRKHTPETRARLSTARMGHEVSEETRAKIGSANKGNQHGIGNKSRTGQKDSQETRARKSAAQKRRRERERFEKTREDH